MPETPSFIRNENNGEDENEEQRVDRRLLLGSLLGMAASGMSSGCAKKFREIQREPFVSADVFLDSFPEQIPGAKKIEKYPVKGAKYCLVHIRQIHDLYFDAQIETGYFLSDADKERTADIQKNIEKILLALSPNAQSSLNIYAEGYWPRRIQESKELRESRKTYCEDWIEKVSTDTSGEFIASSEDESFAIAQLVFKRQTLRDELESLRNRRDSILEKVTQDAIDYAATYDLRIEEKQQEIARVQDELKPLKNRIGYLWGADTKMFFEGKACLLPVMTDRFHEERMKGRSTRDNLMISDDRENELLRIIANTNAPIAYTIYGGGHEWTDPGGRLGGEDNVQQWNKKNPDRKFSLIEITPEGYEEIDVTQNTSH